MTVRRSRIIGCGSYLPERLVTNQELCERLDTSDDWIQQRTGIRERHIAATGEKCSDLAIAASRVALQRAGVDPTRDLDLIVMATTTPDQTFPATATRVQAALGMTRGVAFDLQAVCSGFVFAVTVADNFIRSGQANTALVVGAETYSRILDWEDRGTAVLFGDGAGAIVLTAGEGTGANTDIGVLATRLHTDGRQHDMLYVDGGVSSTQTTGHLRMNGKEVFKHAVTNLSDVASEVLDLVDLSIDQVDWLVPHQANRRILDAIAKRVGLPSERIVVTVDHHANTSAASVPLALDEAMGDGRIRPGQLVLLEAMGGGFSWGAALVRL